MIHTYNQARIQILDFVLNNCISKCFGPASFSYQNADNAFHGSLGGSQNPPIGSLVTIGSAPVSKFYLGWLKEINQSDSRYDTKFLIESIEDHSLCRWENISIWHLPLETSNKYPSWKWNDKQHAFRNKWFDTLKKKRDPYLIRPLNPIFHENGSITLSFRKMWENDPIASILVPNISKIRVSDILTFYDQTLKEYK